MWPPQLTTKLLQRVPQNSAINCSHCTLHLSVGTHSYVFPHPFWYQLYLLSAMLSLKDRTVTITVLGNADSGNGLVTVEQWMNTFCFAWIMKCNFSPLCQESTGHCLQIWVICWVVWWRLLWYLCFAIALDSANFSPPQITRAPMM